MSLKSSVNNIADKNPFLQKDHNLGFLLQRVNQMFARCFYIFNRINCGTVIKLLAVGKEADFIHLINNCRHKFVKSRETSLTKKAFFIIVESRKRL
jgi:hypothetical protein